MRPRARGAGPAGDGGGFPGPRDRKLSSLQWIVFFVAALVFSSLMRHVPGLGWLFRGIWGFWIAVMLLSAGTAWLSAKWRDHLRLRSARFAFSQVDTAHNQGKLGTLLLQTGRTRSAIQALERAVAGEPESAEWHYRLGSALRASRENQRAAAELESALRIAPAHAWGEVGIELALARRSLGDAGGALEALDAREREHGESVRSAYLRGSLLAQLGRRDQARAAFREVGELARRSPRFSRKGTLRWRVLAALALLR